ncbi:MAG: NUDIX domain-containing protein, partial [Candidatus Omnitrophica bacterium]|nr:NUDIX domain-containing protein [Candidatus Omnitrophota bacterium]
RSFTKVVHFYTEFKVNLHVFLCRLQAVPKARKDRKWVSIQEFTKYPMPSGTARIVEKLRESHPVI